MPRRFDLPYPDACGELRVSVASTQPTFSPVHLIFLFRQPVEADDQTPDGVVHCRGSARRWAQLAALAPDAFALAARDTLATVIRREQFEMAESVELTISPWQWRQWNPDGRGGLVNPALFQTIDVERVNTPGATRDAFLADVRANAPAIMRRTWTVPPAFRSAVAEVQPNAKAALPDLTPLAGLLAVLALAAIVTSCRCPSVRYARPMSLGEGPNCQGDASLSKDAPLIPFEAKGYVASPSSRSRS